MPTHLKILVLGVFSVGLVSPSIRERIPSQRPAWVVDPTPALRIGAPDAVDTVYQFVQIVGAVRLTDGRVVIADGAETRWFDSSGRFLYTTSRRGGGPGELRFARAVLRLPGDTVLVEGNLPIKDIFFAPTGKFAREEPLDQPKLARLERWREGATLLLPDRSRILSSDLPGQPPLRPDPGPGHLRHVQLLKRVTWSLDSVIPLGQDAGIEQHGLSLGGHTIFIVHPFYSRSVMAAGGTPLRIVTAQNPDYSVQVWRPNGTLERTITRAGARRPPTAAERAAVPAMIAGYLPSGITPDRVLSDIPVPDLLPAIVQLAVAPNGEILVMREGNLPSQTSSPVDVFDARGRFLATIRLPPRFRIFEVGSDYILGRRLTEDDVQVVELYRLRKQ